VASLEAEITDHVGYEKHDPAGENSGNSRNCEYEGCCSGAD
jgi:transposase-like protein